MSVGVKEEMAQTREQPSLRVSVATASHSAAGFLETMSFSPNQVLTKLGRGPLIKADAWQCRWAYGLDQKRNAEGSLAPSRLLTTENLG